jgi:ubiquinone biosynthesis monooxygenase Coq7
MFGGTRVVKLVLLRPRPLSQTFAKFTIAAPSTTATTTTTTTTATTTTTTTTSSSSSSSTSVVDRVCWDTIAQEKESRGGWPAWLAQDLRSDHAGETGAVYIYKGALAAMRLRSWGARVMRSGLGFESGCPYEDLERQPAYAFAKRHMETEAQHLAAMDKLVPPAERSALLPLWKLAGATTGVLPVLASPLSPVLFFDTINAVETFVEQHYLATIAPLERGLPSSDDEEGVAASGSASGELSAGPYPELLRLLKYCNEEEVHHKDEAAELASAGGLVYAAGDRFHAGSDPWLSPPGRKVANAWTSVVGAGSAFAVVLAKRV